MLSVPRAARSAARGARGRGPAPRCVHPFETPTPYGPQVTTPWAPAAAVLHDELVGTAAADFPDSLRDLLRVADLDADWLVVALEVGGSYRSSWGAVLAVPMPPEGRFASWERLVERHGGELPVRRFPLPSSQVAKALDGGYGLLAELKRWSVRLVVAPLRDVPLVVLVDDAQRPAPPAP